MSLYLGNKKVSGLHIGSAAAGTTPIALAKPTINVNANTGVITATVTQSSAGYVNSGSSSNTLALTTKAGTAITPNSTTQTAVAKNVYTLDAVTVKPVPTEEKTVTANGEYTPTSGKYFSKVKVNIDTGIAVNNQANKDVTPSTQTQTIQPDSGYTGLAQVTVNPIPSNYIIPSGNKEITANGTNIPVTTYDTVTVNVGSDINNEPSRTITPTTSKQTITPTSGYSGLSQVIVNAMPSGTAGTPTATKGTVSNHSVTITPKVTNTTGYITGSTITGTAVTVTASELVSGNKSITANGTNIDVKNYATVSVNVTLGEDSWIVKNSENLHDSSEDVQNTYINGAVETSYNGWTSTGFIPVEPDSYYLIQGTPGNNYNAFYTSTKTTAISSVVIPASPNTGTSFSLIKTDSNTHYIRMSGASSGVANYKIYKAANKTPFGNKAITMNGNGIDVSAYDTVSVNVPTGATINNQNKTVTPSESQQSISADSGYTGLGTVTINPISSTYIGSDILENSSTDLVVSGGTVTAPAGYYAADASASVATMALPTAASSTKSGTTKATIGRSTAAQYINIPVGYNSAAASYTISAVNNGSVTAPSAISGTAATVSTGTNTLTLTKTISVTPNVTTAGYISAGTAGNSSVSLTANITTKAAATITPGTSNQTIAAGTYLTGAQTISGDADLVAKNIKSGVNIFGVTGTYAGEAGLDTSDATATAADLLYNKTAYVDGSKITGAMPNNGATGGTITTQGGTYTIPAGYTSGGTVTANLATGSTTAANISGAAFEESTGDYGFRASVQIQPGYYSSATTVTKEFSTILPAPETEGTSAQVLAGYDLYNHEGQVISGTMANNSIGTITLDQTTTSYTIPAGYHDGTGKVQHTTVNIPDPTISINSSTGVITASGSWTRGFTTDNSYSKTYNLTTLGATTYNVSTSNQTISSGRYLTGNQTIRAVTTSNITAANIKAGVTVQVGDSADADRILGVTGTFTSDATASAADINSGATAYVNGNKITGTQVIQRFYTGSSAPTSSLGSNGDIYLQE